MERSSLIDRDRQTQDVELVHVDDIEVVTDVVKHYSEPFIASVISCLGCVIGFSCLPLSCGCCCNPYKTISKGYKGIKTRFGVFVGYLPDGLHYVNPLSEKVSQIDVRTKLLELQEQTVLTKDNLSIKIDGVVYYNVDDIERAVFGVQDVDRAIEHLALVALRTMFGGKDLQQCLEEREVIANEMQIFVEEHIRAWGIEITLVQLTDIKIPNDIKMILSAAAVAEREGRAKVINAQADVQAARLMRSAAEALNSEAAMQIRLLSTYTMLSESSQSKLVFMPLDRFKSTTGNFPMYENL